MTELPWEIEAPSLAISIAWGDVALHTAHLSPARSFYLGDSTADCVLPDSAIPAGRAPLILAERGAVYLVAHPAMDPEGTITTPGNRARTVGDLARPGISDPSPDVPGAFLIKLAPGTTAALSIGDFTIAITLETRAAVAVAGHYHVSPRSIPFQIGSAALHLALMIVAALLATPRADDRDPPSEDQVYFIQHELARIDEKDAALYPDEREEPPRRTWTGGYTAPPYEIDNFDYSRRLSDRRGEWRADAQYSNNFPNHDGFGAPIDPYDSRYSSFDLAVHTEAYAATRRSLGRGDLPDPSSIRPEAFLNSFDYRYAGPARAATMPFVVHLDAAPSPFEAGHHLLRVGVQGRRAADGAPAIIADKVKIQVDFKLDVVSSYRLLGYEAPGFRAGNGGDSSFSSAIAAGHSVTAVYDVVLANTSSSFVTVRLGRRAPHGYGIVWESSFAIAPRDVAPSFNRAKPSLRLAAAVAGFAEILRKSPHAEKWRLAEVERIAVNAAGEDEQAQELVSLIRTARSLDAAPPPRAWSGRVVDASLMGF